MVDKVSFVYKNSAGSDNNPIAMIVLKKGMLRFYAPNGSPYKANIPALNGNSLSMDEDMAAETFEDFSDRWDGILSAVTTFALKGKHARTTELLISKWSK